MNARLGILPAALLLACQEKSPPLSGADTSAKTSTSAAQIEPSFAWDLDDIRKRDTVIVLAPPRASPTPRSASSSSSRRTTPVLVTLKTRSGWRRPTTIIPSAGRTFRTGCCRNRNARCTPNRWSSMASHAGSSRLPTSQSFSTGSTTTSNSSSTGEVRPETSRADAGPLTRLS